MNPQTTRLREAIGDSERCKLKTLEMITGSQYEGLNAGILFTNLDHAEVFSKAAYAHLALLERFTEAQIEGLIGGKSWIAPSEPDKKMLYACAGAMSPAKRSTPEKVSVKEKHRIRYRAMRDAVIGASEVGLRSAASANERGAGNNQYPQAEAPMIRNSVTEGEDNN